MKNLFDYVLFVFPLAIVIAVALGLNSKNKSEQPEASIRSNHSVYNHMSLSGNKNDSARDTATKYQNFTMSEPFAEHVPFEFTPTAWMEMMNNMMYNMQFIQMMHQMAAMPTQMMNPNMWFNPHTMSTNGMASQPQQPMDPKEYKKWYEQQLKLQQFGK